jgi:hypothetical protein
MTPPVVPVLQGVHNVMPPGTDAFISLVDFSPECRIQGISQSHTKQELTHVSVLWVNGVPFT